MLCGFGAYRGMVIFLAALLWVQARAGGPAAVSPDVAADQLDSRFVLDLHEKKIDDVLTLYTGDAVFVNPDGSEATGAGLRKLYEQVAKAYDSDLRLLRTELKRNLNTIIEDGTYTETLGHRDTGKVDDLKGLTGLRCIWMRMGSGGLAGWSGTKDGEISFQATSVDRYSPHDLNHLLDHGRRAAGNTVATWASRRPFELAQSWMPRNESA